MLTAKADPTYNTNDDGVTSIVVNVTWVGEALDRPSTHGISLPRTRTGEHLTVRLIRAINAQKAFTNPVIKTDVNGKTFVSADCHVLGRYLNRDLTKLGF